MRRALGFALLALLALALVAHGRRASDRVRSSGLVRGIQEGVAGARASARLDARMLRQAEQVLVLAHRLDPAAVEPLSFRGDVLLLAGRHAEAADAYRRAAAFEPRAETLFNWGLALLALGRREEALVQMRRGLSLAPRLAASVPAELRGPVQEAPLEPLP